MSFWKRPGRLWILAVAVAIALFAPSTLVATNGYDDDDDADWETLQKCFGQSQSQSDSSSSSDWWPF